MPLFLVTCVCDEGVYANAFRVVEAPSRLAVAAYIRQHPSRWDDFLPLPPLSLVSRETRDEGRGDIAALPRHHGTLWMVHRHRDRLQPRVSLAQGMGP